MLGASYDWELQTGKRVTLNANLNYQSEAETDVSNRPNTQMEERTLLDLAATLHERDNRWNVTAYVSNVTDEVYRFAALPVAGLWNFTNYGAPRSYGLTLSMKFD